MGCDLNRQANDWRQSGTDQTRWIEHRIAVHRMGPPRFIPVDQLDKYVGFRSVYEYDTATVERLQSDGNTRSVRLCSVHSHILFMDFDNNLPAAKLTIQRLQSGGWGFEVWHSGGRSIHLHVPIEPMQGLLVPASQRAWVRANAVQADLSFYHAGGLYRLPNTFHAKFPGQCKRKLETVTGNLLEIPKLSILPSAQIETVTCDSAARIYISLLSQAADEGNRTPHMFKLLRAAKQLQQEFADFREDLFYWNDSYANPPHNQQTLDQWADRTWRQT